MFERMLRSLRISKTIKPVARKDGDSKTVYAECGPKSLLTSMVASMIASLLLGMVAQVGAQDIATPPTTFSNTFAWVAVDAVAVDGGFAPHSSFLQSLNPGKAAYICLDVPTGKQPAIRRAVFEKRKIDQGSKGQAIEVNGLTVWLDEPSLFVPGDAPTKTHAERILAAENSVKDFPIRCLVVPPDYVVETYEQALPNLPQALGAIPTRIATKGLRWLALGINPKTQQFEGRIQSASAADAQALAKVLPELLSGAKSYLKDSTLIDFLNVLRENVNAKAVDDSILLSFPDMDEPTRASTLTQLATCLLGEATQSNKREKLRKIQLAILNYESANQCFPPSKKSRDANGKSGLSWRVHVLPYFGKKEAALYREFHLDEAWDSEHNRKLIAKLPSCYRVSDNWLEPTNQSSKTVFLAPKGVGTVFGQDSVVRFKDISDGSTLTLSVVEVEPTAAVPWTAPEDYEFKANDPAAGLAFSKDGIALGVAVNGVVRELKKDWDATKYLRLFQADDGEAVQW